MKRKQFLLTGSIITAASLVSYSSTVMVDGHNTQQASDRRPNPGALGTPILKAIALGLNAPNPHNTQAWKFKIIGSSEAIFYVDESRLLTATDPSTRQIHIGCGCFIALFQIGAYELGYEPFIEYLPDGAYPISDIGKKPVARLSLAKAIHVKDPLYKYIFIRQTNRGKYRDSLSQTGFNQIVTLSNPEYTSIELINEHTKLLPILEILYKGMGVECYDWNAYDESRKWFRVKEDIERKKDGLNLRASGMKPGLERWFIETMLSGYSKKTWHDEGNIQSLLRGHYEKVMSSKSLVTFRTHDNQLIDWIKCGRDYARFQLAACGQNFYLAPLSQVLQEYPSMGRLYDAFNTIMEVNEPAKIQMATRIGKADQVEYSYRRDVKELIISS